MVSADLLLFEWRSGAGGRRNSDAAAVMDVFGYLRWFGGRRFEDAADRCGVSFERGLARCVDQFVVSVPSSGIRVVDEGCGGRQMIVKWRTVGGRR